MTRFFNNFFPYRTLIIKQLRTRNKNYIEIMITVNYTFPIKYQVHPSDLLEFVTAQNLYE